ncbi:molybdate ABC transporter substrate-binding protein [Pontiellaceae bacterium B12227]|nr:molybdate ABC transporter substrate-binding protein [Pontiellaceae bacterium B12227]
MKIAATILSVLFIALQVQAGLTVFAAASTTDVMKQLAAAFEANGGEKPRFNFASSGTLARQIDAGAPAGLFLSANVKWMDYVEQKQLLLPDSRRNVAQNALVLIAPKGSAITFEGFPGNLSGRLAIGDPKSVPAGAYAFASLTALNMLDAAKSKLVMSKDVRTVLMYTERGEVDAGIVYSTDAARSGKVIELGSFPVDSHPAIVYPAACLKNSSASAHDFLDFITSAAGRKIWTKHGFKPAG